MAKKPASSAAELFTPPEGEPLPERLETPPEGTLEQSWVPPALLFQGTMVASLRGLPRKLTKDEEITLWRIWQKRIDEIQPGDSWQIVIYPDEVRALLNISSEP